MAADCMMCRTPKPPTGEAPSPVSDDDVLKTRIPASLLRKLRTRMALDGKPLDDFVREAIEEQLRR
jgi:hypothetical protein